MTLKEKFKKWLDTNPRVELRDMQLEIITDDYASEFAEWIDRNYFQGNDSNEYHRSIDEYREGVHFTVKQLLQIYKKAKGLN